MARFVVATKHYSHAFQMDNELSAVRRTGSEVSNSQPNETLQKSTITRHVNALEGDSL